MSVLLPLNSEDLSLVMSHSETREKTLRILQYIGLFMEWFLKTDNAEFAQDFLRMSSTIFFFCFFLSEGFCLEYVRFCRKILLFGKSLTELPRIRAISRYPNRYFLAKSTLLISRVSYMLYYLSDNISMLGKMGFIGLRLTTWIKKVSFTVWMVGVTSSLFYNLVFLRLSYSKELELRSSKMLKMLTPQSALKITSELSQERHYIILNIFRNIADIAIIINKLKFPEIFLRTSFNEGVIGVCGISSSALSLYHFYFKSIYGKTKKKKSGNFGGKLKWEEKFEISLLMDHVFE